jgi:hypothetical protein
MNAVSKLSNIELEATLKTLALNERKLLHAILEHIKEVDTRRLYLERAYPSMYEYLVSELNYSGSAAMRRLEAARLLKVIPSMSEKIQDGSLNLSQIGELSKAIKEKEKSGGMQISPLQKNELVKMISGKTTQETQRDLAQALNIQIKQHDRKRTQQDESVRLEVTISKELYDKLIKCRDLASHQIAKDSDSSSFAAVFEFLANSYIKIQMHKKNVEKMVSAENPTTKGKSSVFSQNENENEKINKTLTPKTRSEILARDKCCQYRDPLTEKQCGSTFLSETDHKIPRWAGGTHAKRNLQILCAGHNQQKYRNESQLKLI